MLPKTVEILRGLLSSTVEPDCSDVKSVSVIPVPETPRSNGVDAKQRAEEKSPVVSPSPVNTSLMQTMDSYDNKDWCEVSY